MIRELEYLDEAIEEAEAAARWYAERSSSAATGFADEIDMAIAAIEQNPEAWPPYDHGTRHYLSLYSGSGQTPGWPVSFSICVTTASSSRTSLG